MEIEPGACSFGRAERIAGQGGRDRRVVRLATRSMRKQLLLPRSIVREATGCQNDATRGNHPPQSLGGCHLDGNDATLADLDRLESAGGEDIGAVFEGGQHQSGDERVPIRQIHGSPMYDQIAEMAGKLAGDKPE